MHIVRSLVAALASAAMLAACAVAPPANTDAERASLLHLHEQVMAAHRDSNLDLLFAAEAPDYLLANRGEVSRPELQARRQRFAAYFASTRFAEYVDVVPPVAQVSADGSLGWVVAQVRARGEQIGAGGAREPVAFESAWVELYEKRQGRWWRMGNVSNFKPVAVAATAQPATLTAPASVQALVQAAQAALGEAPARERLRSIAAVADCTSPSGAAYQTELRSQRGGGFLFKQTWPQRPAFLALINGGRAWTVEEGSGKVSALGAGQAAAIRGHDFHMLALDPLTGLGNAGDAVLLPQPQLFAGTQHWVVRGTDSQGAVTELFFDPVTRLPAGLRMPNPAGRPGETVSVHFERWQRFDGVLLPVRVTATDAKGDWVFRFRDVVLNQVDVAQFAVPASLVR